MNNLLDSPQIRFAAIELIEESIVKNSTISYDWNVHLAADLAIESDDSQINGNVEEFWGTDEDGSDWCVHLVAGCSPWQ